MKYLITIIAFINISLVHSQNINWTAGSELPKQMIYNNFGYDFGMTIQLGYASRLNTKRPILLAADLSLPMGKNSVDDFKLRVGGQVLLHRRNDFSLSAKAYGSLRRHETTLVRMHSFGSEIGLLFGYNQPSWHLAAEAGFDKSIITHLEHSARLQENYKDISNGWFIPSGGNFYYGFQASRKMGKRFELSLRLGATRAQKKDENALLPYYGQIALAYSFGS